MRQGVGSGNPSELAGGPNVGGTQTKFPVGTSDLKRTVLFIAEAVTLAHLARPLALASSLASDRFEAVLARDPRYRWLTDKYPLPARDIRTIETRAFLDALAGGKPVYQLDTLRSYVRDDLALFEAVRPDAIVGDFRLSLSVSARLAGIPYLAITNAYWSPQWTPAYTVPSLPITRVLPLPLADALFRLARPIAFAAHSMPLNALRREHGLRPLGSDLRRIYTDADCILYADIAEMYAGILGDRQQVFLGPIEWSPPSETPEWWTSLNPDLPKAYVNLGSSGDPRLLPTVLDALGSLPIQVIAASAGARYEGTIPANAKVEDYLPGQIAAASAEVVICNGGSPACQQALSAGVPVLGIAGNLDQFLNMHSVARWGAGALLRADRLRAETVRQKVADILASESMSRAAASYAQTAARYRAVDTLEQQLSAILRP